MTVKGFGSPGSFDELLRNLEAVEKGRGVFDNSLAVVDDSSKSIDYQQLEQRIEAKVLDLLRQKRNVQQGVPEFNKPDQIDRDLRAVEDRCKRLVHDPHKLHLFIEKTRDEVLHPALNEKYAALTQRDIVWMDSAVMIGKGVLAGWLGGSVFYKIAEAGTQYLLQATPITAHVIGTLATMGALAGLANKVYQAHTSAMTSAESTWNTEPRFDMLLSTRWLALDEDVKAKLVAEGTPEQLLEFAAPSRLRSGHDVMATVAAASRQGLMAVAEANFWNNMATSKPQARHTVLNAFTAIMQRFGSDLVENPLRVLKFLKNLPQEDLEDPAIRGHVDQILIKSAGITWGEFKVIEDPFCESCALKEAAEQMNGLLRKGTSEALGQAGLILLGPHGPKLLPHCRLDKLAKMAQTFPAIFNKLRIDDYPFWSIYGNDSPRILLEVKGMKFLVEHPFHALLVVARLSVSQREALHSQLVSLARDLEIQGGVDSLVRLSKENLESLVTSRFQNDAVVVNYSDGTLGYYPRSVAVSDAYALRPLMGFDEKQAQLLLNLFGGGNVQGIPLNPENVRPVLIDIALGRLGSSSDQNSNYEIIADLFGNNPPGTL